jgi:hypothetical protein
VLVVSGIAMFTKNPDTRYQPMRDDRGSFIKSATNLNTELDALGVTARGDMRMKRDLDDDSDSFMSGPVGGRDPAGVPLPASTNASTRHVDQFGMDGPHSPVNPSAPFLPHNGAPRHGTPTYGDRNNYGPARSMNSASPQPPRQQYGGGGSFNPGYDRSQSLRSESQASYRPANNAGPQWQRGAGYDH